MIIFLLHSNQEERKIMGDYCYLTHYRYRFATYVNNFQVSSVRAFGKSGRFQ